MPPTILRRIRDLADRLVAVRIVESSVVLAAQAFLALFPLVIIVYAIMPSGAAAGMLDWMRGRFGLGGSSVDAVTRLATYRGALRDNLSWGSFLLVIASATAFTKALQRVYQGAWDLPKLGVRGLWRAVVWLVGMVCYLAFLGWIAHAISTRGVTTPLSLVLGFGLWWWTPFLLLGGRVRWRALVPGAVLTTIAQWVVGLVSLVVMPREVRNNEAAYGPIGVVFALESWLVVVAGVLVAGAALGASVSLDRGRVGTWVRGTPDPEGWRRDVTRAPRR